jgi:hypothetical protein
MTTKSINEKIIAFAAQLFRKRDSTSKTKTLFSFLKKMVACEIEKMKENFSVLKRNASQWITSEDETKVRPNFRKNFKLG